MMMLDGSYSNGRVWSETAVRVTALRGTQVTQTGRWTLPREAVSRPVEVHFNRTSGCRARRVRLESLSPLVDASASTSQTKSDAFAVGVRKPPNLDGTRVACGVGPCIASAKSVFIRAGVMQRVMHAAVRGEVVREAGGIELL
jgi:hypothetical protein